MGGQLLPPPAPPISYAPVGHRLYDLSFLRKIENKESLVFNLDRQKLDRNMTVGLGCLSDLYFLRKNRIGEVIGDCQNLDLSILMRKELGTHFEMRPQRQEVTN